MAKKKLPSPASRRVYLACRAIFTGEKAQLRKLKPVEQLVEAHKRSLGPLLDELGTKEVIRVIRALLERQIFLSELKAKAEFPDLFVSSPERDVQRAESENQAAQAAAEALVEIASLEQFDNEVNQEVGHEDGQKDDDQHPQLLSEPENTTPEMPPLRPANDVPFSLYPSYLPFTTQHTILTTAQRILEECCYDFFKSWMPSILQEKGWDCAAAAELTKWTRTLAKRSGKLPQSAFASSESPLNKILVSTDRLRHTAVHRLPTTARGVSELIECALRLAETLQDYQRAAQLEELHSEIDSNIKAMELNKNALEDEYAREMEEIRRQREELDKKEEGLNVNVLAGDSENKSLIGSLLEESVKRIFYNDVDWHSALEEDQDDAEVQNEGEMDEAWDSPTEVSN